MRVIAATNRNLRDLITQGQFREDLFYRINVIHLVVPPLRERREDIPLLIDHFLRSFTSHGANGNGNGNGASAQPGARDRAGRDGGAVPSTRWPGNVRQVENVIERLVVTGRREVDPARGSAARDSDAAHVGMRPRTERRRTVADDLFKKLVDERESFWTAVYPLYMNREITRTTCATSCTRGSKRRAATTRSSCGSSTWSRATTSAS